MLDKFEIGHSQDSDKGTGVTVILAKEGATGGVSVRGSAPATRDTDLLRCGNLVEKANAVVLSGGSAFGLEAACGVMEYLREKGCGHAAGTQIVPIVSGASLYDLDYKEFAYPDKTMGYRAAEIATKNNFASGSIGAGTGATIGKVAGSLSAVKSGLGIATAKLGDVEMAAIVAVNAVGDVYDHLSGENIKGATIGGNRISSIDMILEGTEYSPTYTNTTIGAVITNAKLTKEQANKLADIAHDGYAMAIRPVHTMADGDTVFALASGEADANFMIISCLAPKLMAEAIKKAVNNA